jgi:glycosyltransferase involved in cell wall biosynthesis
MKRVTTHYNNQKAISDGKCPMDQSQKRVSVVIPLYNEVESLEPLHDELKEALVSISDHEIIFVNDGSTDGSIEVLKKLQLSDRTVRVINFRRNFGKSAALDAAFRKVRGRFVVTLDADLQDDPAEIPELIEKLESEKLDLVSGWKKIRRDPLSKRMPSRLFNYATRIVSGLKLHDFNCGLKAYRVEVVRVLRVHGELHRYIPAIAHRAGFKVGEKPVNHRPRSFGKTKFGPSRFVHGFLDLLTVLFLNRYVSSPLHFFGLFGGLILCVGMVMNGYLLFEKIMGRSIGDRPLLFLAVMMVIVGLQFIFFGLLGEMMAREPKEGETYLIESVWPEEAE